MTVLQNVNLPAGALKVRWREPYVTQGLNQKAVAAHPRGVVAGFTVIPSVGYIVTVQPDPVLGFGMANVLDTSGNLAALTLFMSAPIAFDLTAQANSTVYIVLDAQYAVGSDSASQVKVVDVLDDPNFVVLAKVTVPAAPPIIATHINMGYATVSGESIPLFARSPFNLVFNPDFEVDVVAGGAAGWTASGVAAVCSTDFAHTGTKSLKITPISVASTVTSGWVPVVAGQDYRVGGWVRTDGAGLTGTGLLLSIQFADRNYAPLTTVPIETPVTGAVLSFIQRIMRATAPALAAHARVIVSTDVTTSGVAYLDDAEVSSYRADAVSRSPVFGGVGVTADEYHTHTSAGLSYAGGPAWADGTTNPGPVTVEAQLDKILTDLGVTSGIGAAKISFTPVTPLDLTAIRVDTALNQLDDLKAGINLVNTFTRHNNFNNTGSAGQSAITATVTGAANGVEGYAAQFQQAGLFGQNSAQFGYGVWGRAPIINGIGVFAEGTAAGSTALLASNTGLNSYAIRADGGNAKAMDLYNESGVYTASIANGDSGPALSVAGGHGYATDVISFETLSGDPAYSVVRVEADASKGIFVNTQGSAPGLRVDTNGASGLGLEIHSYGGGGRGITVNTDDGDALFVSANGANRRAIDAYNESAAYTINVLNGDGGPGLNVDGGDSYGDHVARFSSAGGGGRVVFVDASNGASGIEIEGTTNNGLLITMTSGNGRGIDVETDTGQGVRIQAQGTGAIGTYTYSATNLGLQAESDRAVAGSAGSLIKSFGTSHALRVESVTASRVIEVIGPTIGNNVGAADSINKSNLLRAWIQVDDLSDPSLASNHSFSIASVTASNTGRLTFNFTTGTMPTNGYIPQLTFMSVGVGTTLQPILVNITQSSTQYAVDVYTGTGGGTKIDLTLGSLGVHACFFGVSASF